MNVKQTQKASQPAEQPASQKATCYKYYDGPTIQVETKMYKKNNQEIKREGRKKICIVLCVSPECKMKMKNANEKANENQMECLIANERAEEW